MDARHLAYPGAWFFSGSLSPSKLSFTMCSPSPFGASVAAGYSVRTSDSSAPSAEFSMPWSDEYRISVFRHSNSSSPRSPTAAAPYTGKQAAMVCMRSRCKVSYTKRGSK